MPTALNVYTVHALTLHLNSPSDKLRGGHNNDPENFVAFLKEMREAANKETLKEGQERMLLSIALPGGPFHGQYFNIPKLAQYGSLAIQIDKKKC